MAYGSKWYQAVLPLQLMTIYGLARAIAINMGNVFKAGGKPKWLLYIATARLANYGRVALSGHRQIWEVDGVAGLSAVVSVLDFALSAWLTNRILQASWKRYVQILAAYGHCVDWPQRYSVARSIVDQWLPPSLHHACRFRGAWPFCPISS